MQYEQVSIDSLDLDRVARKMSVSEEKKLHNAHIGFIWDNEDNYTKKWRPQGITGLKIDDQYFIIISWYWRGKDNHSNKGVRISIVNITNENSINYRHVLLVDTEFKPLSGMHAGGLVIYNNELHVPDTRNGKKEIKVFSLADIKAIPSNDRGSFFNFSYLLNQTSSYNVSIKPSFMSYDWSRKQILTGTFSKKKRESLQWFSPENNQGVVRGPFLKKMQGAISSGGTLWVACSYGRYNQSRLYVGKYARDDNMTESQFTHRLYPPGLEDMHIEELSDNIWMLTEFGPHEGFKNNRIVFATLKKLLIDE